MMDELDPKPFDLGSLIWARLDAGHSPGRIAMDLEQAQPGLGREMLPRIHRVLAAQSEETRMVHPLAMTRRPQRTCTFIAVDGKFVPAPQRATRGIPRFELPCIIGPDGRPQVDAETVRRQGEGRRGRFSQVR